MNKTYRFKLLLSNNQVLQGEKTMKQLKVIHKVTIGFFSLLLIISSAQATPSNRHDYNGSYCNPLVPADAIHFTRSNAGIKNNSNENRFISCPVLVDEHQVNKGTFRTNIYYTGTGQVECAIYSVNAAGFVVQSRSKIRNNTGWVGIQGLTKESRWGSYSIYCNVPAGGTINMIAVNERTQ